jgi:hypothetical protein
MIAHDVLAALTPVVEVLERLGVMYHIGGSIASSAYGIARSTLDVDVVADLRPQHVQSLVEQLQPAYYIDADAVRSAIRERASFNVIHLASMIKRAYLQRWASRLGIADLLKRALVESGL